MFCVGIDIAKVAHEAAILNDSDTSAGSNLKVQTTTVGALKLLSHLEKTGVSADNAVIGMEATGHYWLAIYSVLVGKGYTVKVINPIVTDAFAFQLRQLLEQISFIENQVDTLDREIAAYMKRTNRFITTIPGIGPVLGAVSQSGNFEGTQMHMSKRGSP